MALSDTKSTKDQWSPFLQNITFLQNVSKHVELWILVIMETECPTSGTEILLALDSYEENKYLWSFNIYRLKFMLFDQFVSLLVLAHSLTLFFILSLFFPLMAFLSNQRIKKKKKKFKDPRTTTFTLGRLVSLFISHFSFAK